MYICMYINVGKCIYVNLCKYMKMYVWKCMYVNVSLQILNVNVCKCMFVNVCKYK